MMKSTLARGLVVVLAASLIGLLLARYWHSRVADEEREAGGTHATSDLAKPASIVSAASTKRAVETQRKPLPVAADGTVEIPPRYRLPGVDRVRTANSFKEWLAKYPAADQAKIKAFNDHYNDVYNIASPQQIAWMAQAGYPMPEDVVVAAAFSDQQLTDLARQGNDKAGFILQDRLIERYQAARQAYLASGGNPNTFDSDPMRIQIANDLAHAELMTQKTLSPFEGYLEANEVLGPGASDPSEQQADLIAGLSKAFTLGDTRTQEVLSSYVNMGMVSEDAFNAALKVSANYLALMGNNNCNSFLIGKNIPDPAAPAYTNP